MACGIKRLGGTRWGIGVITGKHSTARSNYMAHGQSLDLVGKIGFCNL